MKKRLLVAVVTLIALGGATGWSDVTQHVRYPVSGEYVERMLGAPVAYDGVLDLFWTPVDSGSGSTEYTIEARLSADARCSAAGARYLMAGSASVRIALRAGAPTSLNAPYTVVCLDCGRAFTGTLVIGLHWLREVTLPVLDGLVIASP